MPILELWVLGLILLVLGVAFAAFSRLMEINSEDSSPMEEHKFYLIYRLKIGGISMIVGGAILILLHFFGVGS